MLIYLLGLIFVFDLVPFLKYLCRSVGRPDNNCVVSVSRHFLFIFITCYNIRYMMAPHSSTLAWKVPWIEEPGGLQSMGSLRVRYDWVTSLSIFTFMHWRRKWQLTPLFLPGESQGWGSLAGCRLFGCTESETTEATQQQQQQCFIKTMRESLI